MSHFTVVVCLDDPKKLDEALAPFSESLEVEPYRDYLDDWQAAYERALKFYAEHPEHRPAELDESDVVAVLSDYNGADVQKDAESDRYFEMSTYNPESKWDWYLIGGRWTGYFKAASDAPRAALINGQPGVMTRQNTDPSRCDGGQKRHLDLGSLRDAKGDEARELHEKWLKVVQGTPEARPFREFADVVDKVDGYTIDRAREEYHSQPRIEAIKGTDVDLHFDCPIEYYQKPQRLFVELARAQAVPGYAVLTLDGKWMAPGRMGFWGFSSDDESTRAGYFEVANAYIDSLPDSTWLIAVDCHI